MAPACTFTIEPLKFRYPEEFHRQGNLYKLFQEGQEVGIFHYEVAQSYIRWQDHEIRVDSQRRTFRKSSFKLVDPATEDTVGYYENPDLLKNRALYYRQHPLFEFNRIPLKIRDLFKRSSGTAYQFTLTGLEGNVLYATDGPHFSARKETRGTVVAEGNIDLPIILAGFLFIELVWEQQSST